MFDFSSIPFSKEVRTFVKITKLSLQFVEMYGTSTFYSENVYVFKLGLGTTNICLFHTLAGCIPQWMFYLNIVQMKHEILHIWQWFETYSPFNILNNFK